MPPAAEAVENADPPYSATAHALQLPEVIARRATAGVILLVRRAATATALTTPQALPVDAAGPLVLLAEVGADELEDRLGRELGVDEQGGPIDDLV